MRRVDHDDDNSAIAVLSCDGARPEEWDIKDKQDEDTRVVDEMARMAWLFITRRWRMPKIMLALMVIEFPLTVAALALFGIADPDTYRTKLWQNGADQKFNSSPVMILYAFANYKPIPVPLVWSSLYVSSRSVFDHAVH